MQTKKIVKRLATILISLLIFMLGLKFYSWYHFYNKNNLIEKYTTDSKEVYILGTIGKKHFNRMNNYSMEDMLSAIENIKPDVVMLTAREDHRINYNIIDGDIDSCVAYSYCFDKDIPVKMIDWWIIDNIWPKASSTNLRDDNIFIKISRTLRESQPNSKLLVITDSHNFYEQIERFKVSGFKKQRLENDKIKSLFVSNSKDDKEFEFPPLASKIWKDRSYFYAYVFPRVINENEVLLDEVKEKYIKADHDKFYRKQIKYCKYLNNNILYK